MRPMHSSRKIPSDMRLWVLYSERKVIKALGKSHRQKKSRTLSHSGRFSTSVHLLQFETCDVSRNPTKIMMDEYTQMMIQRRFTRGQGSQEEFLQSMGLGQYRLGRRVQQLDKNINHSHILSRNKIH